MTELKPCPFCGNILEDIGSGQYFHSKTDECWLDKEIFDFSDEDLLEEWNKRVVKEVNKMTMDQIRKAIGQITAALPEKTYLRKDVKMVLLEVLKKLEEVNK